MFNFKTKLTKKNRPPYITEEIKVVIIESTPIGNKFLTNLVKCILLALANIIKPKAHSRTKLSSFTFFIVSKTVSIKGNIPILFNTSINNAIKKEVESNAISCGICNFFSFIIEAKTIIPITITKVVNKPPIHFLFSFV